MKLGITGQLKTKPVCPKCETLLDGFTGVDNTNSPESGDITICAYCTTILKFTDNMGVDIMTAKELDEIPKEELYLIVDAQKAAAKFRDILKR